MGTVRRYSELHLAYCRRWAGEKGEKARAGIPTRRFAQPREVAEAARYLSSDAAAMINGANLLLDGGNTIQ
jgi:NAD(P)-dependent dehydrogenase (short-subunit alcohol dehydrogenase family)